MRTYSPVRTRMVLYFCRHSVTRHHFSVGHEKQVQRYKIIEQNAREIEYFFGFSHNSSYLRSRLKTIMR